jgi:alginate O-acetyltransferase complex protein AlgJ
LDQAHRRLDPLGVELVVAVVPDKLRVVPEHRGALELPAEIETRYDRALKLARDLGLGAPDLRQAMIEARAQGEVFLRTDTHWSPWGARAAALAIARGLPAHRQPSRERWVVQERVEMEGDLLRFLPLGPLAWMGPPADQLEVGRREGPEARSSTLLDEPELDIWLVGTSFSADPRWAFADALQIALGREVLNLARSGEGPLPPLEAALADPLLSERPPRVLIWELPERALSTDLRGELL